MNQIVRGKILRIGVALLPSSQVGPESLYTILHISKHELLNVGDAFNSLIVQVCSLLHDLLISLRIANKINQLLSVLGYFAIILLNREFKRRINRRVMLH